MSRIYMTTRTVNLYMYPKETFETYKKILNYLKENEPEQLNFMNSRDIEIFKRSGLLDPTSRIYRAGYKQPFKNFNQYMQKLFGNDSDEYKNYSVWKWIDKDPDRDFTTPNNISDIKSTKKFDSEYLIEIIKKHIDLIVTKIESFVYMEDFILYLLENIQYYGDKDYFKEWAYGIFSYYGAYTGLINYTNLKLLILCFGIGFISGEFPNDEVFEIGNAKLEDILSSDSIENLNFDFIILIEAYLFWYEYFHKTNIDFLHPQMDNNNINELKNFLEDIKTDEGKLYYKLKYNINLI